MYVCAYVVTPLAAVETFYHTRRTSFKSSFVPLRLFTFLPSTSNCFTHFEKMENCSNGTSNCSHLGEGQELDGPGFGAFSLLMVLLSVAQCVLMILTIVALCMARSMSKHLRIFLINILVAALVMGGTFLVLTMLPVILVFAETGLPPVLLCRLLVWALGVGGYARPLSVAAYSIVVLVNVKFGKKDWKTLYSSLSIAILWLIALVMNTILLLPQVTTLQYLGGVMCYTDTDASIVEVLSVFSFIRLVFGSVAPLAVCIVIPIYTLYYIRKHTISGDAGYTKAVTRLALFLVTGNAVNFAGTLLIVVAAYFSTAAVSVYLLIGFGVPSLLPTPIFIIMFLKLVQDQMKAIITCHCSHSHAIHPMQPLEKS